MHSKDLIHLKDEGSMSSVRKAAYFNEKNVIKANVGILVPSGIKREIDSCFSFLAKH